MARRRVPAPQPLLPDVLVNPTPLVALAAEIAGHDTAVLSEPAPALPDSEPEPESEPAAEPAPRELRAILLRAAYSNHHRWQDAIIKCEVAIRKAYLRPVTIVREPGYVVVFAQKGSAP
jgi:hypothetical protein